jgi:dUTPase
VPPESNHYTDISSVQAGSLNLHIGGIYLPRTTAEEPGGEHHPLTEYLLAPGQTVLVRTAETLRLPKHVAGLAFPPSGFAVKALLVTNAGHVDPEYSGPLRFTIINMGHQVQKLENGLRVGRLVLFGLDRAPERGWRTRMGKDGRNPNTEDLRHLSTDFAEVENRARQIARDEVQGAQLLVQQVEQRWNRRLTFAGILFSAAVLLIVGFFTWHSPIARLDTKIDLVRDDFSWRPMFPARRKILGSKWTLRKSS